jgi:hypothetical protein
VKARKGVTIVYPVKCEGRQVIDHIPPGRNAVVIWHDQFGSVHATAFGDIDTADQRFDKVVEHVARKFKMFARHEP